MNIDDVRGSSLHKGQNAFSANPQPHTFFVEVFSTLSLTKIISCEKEENQKK